MKAKLELLKPTNMVEYAMEIYQQLNGTDDVPAEMVERKDTILQQLTDLQGAAQPLLDICSTRMHMGWIIRRHMLIMLTIRGRR